MQGSRKSGLGRSNTACQDHPNHPLYRGCKTLDERHSVLLRLEAKRLSDVLDGRFSNQVDNFPDNKEGKKKRKNGRGNLKKKMSRALEESNNRIAAAAAALASVTTATTRIVYVLGIEHTFQFDELMEEIYNVVVRYCDVMHNRNIEGFDGITKEQGMVRLLSLSDDQFNDTFNGRFDINTASFFASKRYVKEYAKKLTEASTAAPPVAAAAPATTSLEEREREQEHGRELFQLMLTFMTSTAQNLGAAASNQDAERVERIAGQEQHKALIERNSIEIGTVQRDNIGRDKRIDIIEREVDALTQLLRRRMKRGQAHPVSIRRSARKKPAKKYGAK